MKMIVFDTRLVHGYPLQYYQPVSEKTSLQYQPLVQEYQQYYGMNEISEEFTMPNSPHSVQSDSDNSMSSTDVARTPLTSTPSTFASPPIKSITTKTLNTKSSEVKCGWRQCGLWFESLDQLATHVSKAHASSGPSGLFYCGWEGCMRNNKGFNARYKMLVHVRTHTNEKPHQCYQCDKSFSRAENLKIHSRSHSGEKPYACPVPGCNKAYSNSSDRFKHTRTHQDEKPYLCKVPGCPKRYTDPSSLRKHVKTYKHFISEQPEREIAKTVKTETEVVEVVPTTNSNNEKNILSCSCPHTCCLKTCLTKAAELFKLGALINFGGGNLEGVSWNKLFLDPIVSQKQIYSGFSEEQMDCDGPLDLTVHRK